MAVATPILERRKEETQEEVEYTYTCNQTEDEIHNSKIREIYARLIKPETTMSDLKSAPAEPEHAEFVNFEPAQLDVPVQNEVYQVEGARTSAELFRADSAINRKVTFAEVETQPVAAVQLSEEENEDLVPTRTTMQYTSANKTVDEVGSIATQSSKKRMILSKRDKAIIAAVISVIVALLTLIIVNSAIISSVNRDISTLQSSLEEARSSYEYVSEELAQEEANFESRLEEYARQNGMTK